MIEFNLDTTASVLYIRPKSALEKSDFAQLSQTVDPHIEKTGGLEGVLVEAATFPGWSTLGALIQHMRFVRDHQKYIKKIAIVTDSAIGNVAENIAAHFIAADIKHFRAGELEAAKRWITSSG